MERGQAHGPDEHVVATEEPASSNGERAAGLSEEDLGPVPLHLKILGVALVIYLAWRLVQGVGWVINQF